MLEKDGHVLGVTKGQERDDVHDALTNAHVGLLYTYVHTHIGELHVHMYNRRDTKHMHVHDCT